MKPLVLHAYPKHPTADDTYHIGGAWAPACITAADKRFTPGELAATYWKARALGWPVLRQNTIYKFAATPDYDQ